MISYRMGNVINSLKTERVENVMCFYSATDEYILQSPLNNITFETLQNRTFMTEYV